MFAQLLWKEWRDNRTQLMALWALTPLIVLALGWYAGGSVLDAPDAPTLLGLGATLACLFTVGLTLFSGEWTRGHFRFLHRLPGGIHLAFGVKLSFLLVAILLSALWSASLTGGLQGILQLNSPEPWMPWSGLLVTGLILCVVAPLAVSAWGIQPGFAILGAPIVAFLLSLPIWLAVLEYEPKYHQFGLAQAAAWSTALAGLLLSLHLGFVRSRGKAAQGTAWLALLVALAAHLPAWGLWGMEHWHASQLTPENPRFEITEASLSPGGKTALLYVQTTNKAGQIKTTGTLEVQIGSGAWTLLEASRDFSLPPLDKTRALMLSLHSKLNLAEGTTLIPRHGLGFAITKSKAHNEPRDYYDLHRDQIFDSNDRLHKSKVLILPGPWLLLPTTRAGIPNRQRTIQLYDPVTETVDSITGIESPEYVGPALQDGRVIIAGPRGLFLYDSRTKGREKLEELGQVPSGRSAMFTFNRDSVLDSGPSPLLSSRGHTGWLDLENNRIYWSKFVAPAVASRNTGNTIFNDGRRLIEHDFIADESTVLFPTEE